MLSRARIEGRARPPRGVNPYIRAPAPTCYVRWSNVAANPNVTSGERTYRQGNDRPCAGLRWPRTANPASGQSLHLPSALHDAHPLWRTQKIWTVIDIEVVSQHANAADVTTAQRGVPLQALQARAPTTIRPAAVDPLTAPRVATFGKTRQGSLVREGLMIESVKFRYDADRYGEDIEKLVKTTQFVAPVVVTKRILRCRAMFDCPWSVVGVADVDPELVDSDQLTAWLATGGRRVGLGDWRPEKSGHYGRFDVEKVTELPDAA